MSASIRIVNIEASVISGGTIETVPGGGRGGDGGVTKVVAGSGLNGGTFTTSGTISLASPVPVALGGTGNNTFTPHGPLVGDGVGALIATAPGNAGDIYTSNGASADPAFSSLQSALDTAVGWSTDELLYRAADGLAPLIPGAGVSVDGGTLTFSSGALPVLANANIWIGNASTLAVAHAISGDASLSNTGALTVTKTGGATFANSAVVDATNATNIASGTLAVARGGSGAGTFTSHAPLVGEGTSAFAAVTPGAANSLFVSNGSTLDPSFKTVGTILDSVLSWATNDLLYRSAGGLAKLTPGSGITISAGTISATSAGLPALADASIWIGNSSTVATALPISGDATLADTGALTVTKTSGVAFAASATTNALNASNISSGTLPNARIPNPGTATLGGVQAFTAPANNWINSISTAGVPGTARPAFSDLTGNWTIGQGVSLSGASHIPATGTAAGVVQDLALTTVMDNALGSTVNSVAVRDGTSYKGIPFSNDFTIAAGTFDLSGGTLVSGNDQIIASNATGTIVSTSTLASVIFNGVTAALTIVTV